ncbi:family 43 glycosylhydrolase [Bacteroides uniformis]|nr:MULTISPECIES: family 43 glycosylhydrolase [Bacteroides]MCB7405557.1 family 43 glycosylhydrolase [Bacteroides uniformis]MCB7416703.1 family 43 glycosylhydrolase [Bacteroides uniformis]MCM1631108.1 family 43 glycosylhydrolase [Bacteroides uniformis]MCM1727436.1 family 43 glycosylhydrolase [Bacteroides uniformis]MCM1839188.1 family 43 glycosylhydrolase [Bacteroides uniformis]
MLLFVGSLHAQYRTTTYCNPLNLDYTYPFHNSHLGKSYRSGADPAVVEFRGEYYMFVTRSWGYWHSKDLLNWDFITPEKWYFEGCNAPAAHNYKDSVLYVCGNPSGAMSILYTDNPKRGDWKAVPSVLHDLQDPALFIDDDERAYMYWGSSNRWPIRGKELDMKNKFLPIAKKPDSLLFLRPDIHGWERFGENHTSDIKPFIEGAWMTKHNGKYYLQYAAPGTQFNVYGDGVYVGKSPLGPFQYAAHNPFCYKPGGFATGAGHGSTVCGPGGIYWHFGTIHLSINYKFERRLCMFPTFFDEDGVMYSDTYFGDYPHYSPDQVSRQTTSGGFRGWMLLSYGKPVKASSQLESYPVENVTDENLKTFWVAGKNDDKQWVEIDLEEVSDVYALQLNFFDYEETGFWGRMPNLRQRYLVEASVDGARWRVLVDYRNSFRDAPHNYIELDQPIEARYIRYRHHYVPGKNLAMGDIRVFGLGRGKKPATVKGFTVVREADERNARISWKSVKGAQGYNVLWGVAPDKLYSSWMVYGDNSLDLRALTVGQKYYFAIESFNENGISQRVFLREAH